MIGTDNMIKKIEGEYEIENKGLTYIFKDLKFDASESKGLHLKGSFEIKEANKKGKFSINFGEENDEDDEDFKVYDYINSEDNDEEDVYDAVEKLYKSFKMAIDIKQNGKDITIKINLHYKDYKKK